MIRLHAIILASVLLMSSLLNISISYASDDVFTIDISSDSVDISTGFNGAEFSVFGTTQTQGDVAIVIEGPPRSFTVRRKDQVGGLWMNKQSMRFAQIPVYYDVALSRPAFEIATPDVLENFSIGLDQLKLQHRGNHNPEDIKKFKEALVRNKQVEGNFPLEPGSIEFLSPYFFRADFTVPANVPTGDYRIRAFLLQDQQIIESEEVKLSVAQVGLSARLYKTAYQASFLYGLSSIFFALFAGFGAYFLMRR